MTSDESSELFFIFIFCSSWRLLRSQIPQKLRCLDNVMNTQKIKFLILLGYFVPLLSYENTLIVLGSGAWLFHKVLQSWNSRTWLLPLLLFHLQLSPVQLLWQKHSVPTPNSFSSCWQETLLLVGLTPMAKMGLEGRCVRPELQKFCFALRTGN